MSHRSERLRLLLRAIRREPGCTTEEAARYAGCDVQKAEWSMRYLRPLVTRQGPCWRAS